MKKVFFLVLFLVSVSLDAKNLSGNWVAIADNQRVSLEFLSASRLSYNGEVLAYQKVGSDIKVADEYGGYINYPYKMKNKVLYITFPEGYTLVFKQISKYKNKRTSNLKSGSDTYLLNGRLCSYSSSYNGGYSHSNILYFDGRGRYSTSEQSYSSGDSGNYVNNGASDGGGTYSVDGINIYVHVNGGNSFSGKVTQRDNSGAITGINVNGNIFAKGLCD